MYFRFCQHSIQWQEYVYYMMDGHILHEVLYCNLWAGHWTLFSGPLSTVLQRSLQMQPETHRNWPRHLRTHCMWPKWLAPFLEGGKRLRKSTTKCWKVENNAVNAESKLGSLINISAISNFLVEKIVILESVSWITSSAVLNRTDLKHSRWYNYF